MRNAIMLAVVSGILLSSCSRDISVPPETHPRTDTRNDLFVYGTDTRNWVPNSVEIQIADDFAEQWANSPAMWQCAAIFGRLAPIHSAVKRPGEWNRMTITCRDQMIYVMLNGEID